MSTFYRSAKSDCLKFVAILGPIWLLPRGFSVPQNISDVDIGLCLESPVMAITRRQSHLLTMSEVAPTPDLRARMSGIVLFSSGLPPRSGSTGCYRQTGSFDSQETFARAINFFVNVVVAISRVATVCKDRHIKTQVF